LSAHLREGNTFESHGKEAEASVAIVGGNGGKPCIEGVKLLDI